MNQKGMAIKMLARNGWRVSHGVRLLLAVIAAVLLTMPAWIDIALTAIHKDYAKPVVLVIPVMVWLIWVRRARFRFVRPKGFGVGLVILIAGIQFYYMGQHMYGIRSAGHLGAVLITGGAIILCTGKSTLRQFLPAWLIMPFLVPVPHTLAVLIATPIQVFEANVIAQLYGLFDIGVQVFTNAPGKSLLLVGDTTLPLDSACKGLPTILSLMLISYGFVFGSPMRPAVRAMLLLISPVIALLCSALALGGTLWLYDGRSALMTADLIRAFSEWATLLLAFLLIAGALRVLVWASVPVHQYHLASASA